MSGIRIVRESERLEWVGNGCTIFYRRVPGPVRAEFIRRNTNRNGVIDWAKVSKLMLEYAILGWEGVFEIIDGKKMPVEFETALVTFIPENAQLSLIELLGDEASAMEAADAKNSEPSPVSR